eukprot:CAMPEP_0114436050 /NCGR_PEP_ID=MMETSP0103-20121206/13212_1 /TAXON_ID=37642 ORGANISM="Paraphysomonas imperforata, Strain PA2" /NCGR_SAMPLE_ID=MMETSP0103 /ASSEMBLY_ACC=CAM_ASM_000201 /LENGTH=31 /DNA_ID= /DNA_START= /DNA_END= /DNA_ORIENTATION=
MPSESTGDDLQFMVFMTRGEVTIAPGDSMRA